MPCCLPLVEHEAMSHIAGQMAVAYASGKLGARTSVAIQQLFPSAQYFRCAAAAARRRMLLPVCR